MSPCREGYPTETDGEDSMAEDGEDMETRRSGRASARIFSEVRDELGRVTWPSRKEVYATTVVVILTVGCSSGCIWFVVDSTCVLGGSQWVLTAGSA